MADLVHASSIRANHLVWVHHDQRDEYADEGQNQESNLYKHHSLLTNFSNDIRMCRCQLKMIRKVSHAVKFIVMVYPYLHWPNGEDVSTSLIQKPNKTHRTLKIVSKCNSRTHDASKIENSPEYTDVHALLSLSGVRHHQRTLGGPKKSCTDAKDGTGCDNECTRARMDVNNTVRETF